ncbi:MAG TPA: hypothetical protein VGB70_11895 [Allosphingosinicella sp.]|jgi:hypothetical protein
MEKALLNTLRTMCPKPFASRIRSGAVTAAALAQTRELPQATAKLNLA